jgi:hypothetical protein
MKIADIKIGNRVRRDPGDIESLAKSIQQVGLLHPVVVNSNNELVSGYRRIEACKKLGWDEIPHTTGKSLDDITLKLNAEADENVQRKNLSPLEAAEMAERLETLAKGAAKKRSDEGRKRGGRARHDASLRNNFPEAAHRAADQIANAVGYSRTTLEKAKVVAQAAKDDPEHYGKLAEEMNATGKLDPAFKKLKRTSASDNAGKTRSDAKLDCWYDGIYRILRVIDRAGKLGCPANILEALSINERQGCARQLAEIAEVILGWVLIVADRKTDPTLTDYIQELVRDLQEFYREMEAERLGHAHA